MLNLFRRHTKKCPHDSREALKCHCPIWFDWTLPTGERLRKPLGPRDWQAAQRRARDMEADGITSVGEAVTVKKAIEDFEKDAKTTIEDTTLKQYRVLLARLETYCQEKGYVFLKQLGVVQAREFRLSWTTYSPRTAGKHIERLKRFFNWCVENRWLESSPAKPLKNPKVEETDVVPFDEDVVERILNACNAYRGSNRPGLILLTKLMLATGLSLVDAVSLSKDKIVKNSSG